MKRLILILLISVSLFAKDAKINDQLFGIAWASVAISLFSYGMYEGTLSEKYPNTFYMANNTRGLFDGLDRETHFVGGAGAY